MHLLPNPLFVPQNEPLPPLSEGEEGHCFFSRSLPFELYKYKMYEES